MAEPGASNNFNVSPEIIRRAVMLGIRFPLSLWDLEDLAKERGGHVSRETIRSGWHGFGPTFAAEIPRLRIEGMRLSRWCRHLDAKFVKINGWTCYLWRTVDHEGELFESFVTRARDKTAVPKSLRKAMRNHGQPEAIVTDRLRPYGAAPRKIGSADRQETSRWTNSRAENSHTPFRTRKRAMLRFRRMRSLQMFAPVHVSVSNQLNQERNLFSRNLFKLNRAAAFAEWRQLCTAQGTVSLSWPRLVRLGQTEPPSRPGSNCRIRPGRLIPKR
jgi:putative transposase